MPILGLAFSFLLCLATAILVIAFIAIAGPIALLYHFGRILIAGLRRR
jgi:hypothetical protein